MEQGTVRTATVEVRASPDVVYDLVSDVRRMGEWSPETHRAEWIDRATGPSVGARFRGSNRRGFLRWSTTPRVLVADAGREFTFVTELRGKPLTKWSYRMSPGDDVTTVTETFEIVNSMAAMEWVLQRVLRIDREQELETGMRQTLERIKAAAEQQRST